MCLRGNAGKRCYKRKATWPISARQRGPHPPVNKLSAQEWATILALCHRPTYQSLPLSQIVPRLADHEESLASESSFYRVLDIFSRKIVGWEIQAHESATQASGLIREVCLAERIHQDGVVLHADNGGLMKGATMLATLQKLGIVPSFSRPPVNDDNPYPESLFRTLKYVPG